MLISIIIPIYNVEKYLNRCLDSVVKQSFKDIEIILVNDGSTDNSENVLKNYLIDERIKYIYQKNKGLSEARNAGLNIASGEYVLFLDSDDSIEPTTCYELSQIVRKNEVDIVVFGRYLIKNCVEKVRDTAYWGNNLLDGKEYLVQSKLNNHFSASACNKLYKLSFLRQKGLNFKSGIVYEDLLFNFHCMIQGVQVYVLDKLLYNYYVGRDDSIINTVKEKDLDILLTVNELFSIYEKYNEPIIRDVFYWIIYDWVSNAVSYKYPRIAMFNKKAISITRVITQDSKYKSVLLYCSTCHMIGVRRRILSWLQVRMFYVYYFLIGLLVRIKKLI